MLTEVERLSRLFQNILEMARIDAGAIAIEPQWVHLSEIIEAARALVEHTLGSRRLEVRIEVDHLVQLDPRLTASALSHLLENAAQYSPLDSPILVEARMSGHELEVAVRDQGPGVSVEDLPHLFERFYRGNHAKRRVSGTGMGLAIARGFVAAEQGRVWAENCADGGARFIMVVPVKTREVEPVAMIS